MPDLDRAERVQVLDAWLAKLLDDAVAGTPPAKQRRGAPCRRPAPPASPSSPSAASGDASCRRSAISTSSSSTTVGRRSRRSPTPSGTRWDTGLRLDHSVRSIADAVGVASTDVKAGLGLLDARLVAGDADLAARLRTATLASWRQAASACSRSCVTSVAGGRGRSANSPSCSSRT